MPRHSIWVLALFAIHFPEASAQVAPTPGDLVRVRVEGSNYVGRFVGTTPDVIRLTLGEESTIPVELLRPSVKSIEISRGRRRRFARNFGITLAATGTAGALIGAAAWAPCNDSGFSCFLTPESRSEAATLGLVVGALVGLPLGLLIGLNESEQWTPAAMSSPTTSQLRIQPILGVHPGVAVSFVVSAR